MLNEHIETSEHETKYINDSFWVPGFDIIPWINKAKDKVKAKKPEAVDTDPTTQDDIH